MSKTNISRRDFLKGVTAGAVGFAATSLLGACSSGETECPQTECTVNNVTVTWPNCEPTYSPLAAGEGEVAFVSETIKDSEIVKTETVDVLVCGLGPAGFAASLACAEKGLKTVVVEKGYSGTYRSATIGGTTDRIHKMYGVTFDENEWLKDAMANSSWHANQAVYKKWLATNGEAVDWFLDHFDFSDNQYTLTFFGYSGVEFPDFKEQYDVTARSRSWNTSINIPMAPNDIVTHLTEEVQKAGAEIHFETPVVQLVKEGDAVTGAIVKTAEGYVKYNTNKGVVLATGGYEFNLKKLQECCRPRDLQLCGWMNGTVTNTGDGHEMAKAIGGMEDEYPHALMLDPMQLMPYVRVNSEGKRFMGEYETYDHMATMMQAQYGSYDYFITDANAFEAVEKMWSPSSSCYGPKEIWAGAAQSENALVADTLEELADKMGVNKENFVSTIKHWNEMCDKGVDEDFNYPGQYMHKIDTAPFYATREMAEALCTAGGLQITPDSEVLDTNNKPIAGLYAIGNVSGSMFSGTYPHSQNCISHSRCITFGYNVAKTLAAK